MKKGFLKYCFILSFNIHCYKFFQRKWLALIAMSLRTLIRRMHGGKRLVFIKCRSLDFFEGEVTLLCQLSWEADECQVDVA